MDEDVIQRLHTYDWQQFKADRNFYEKQPENSGVMSGHRRRMLENWKMRMI